MIDFGKRLDGPGGRRVAAREPVLLNAALLSLQASRPVTLVDVSKTGARLRTTEPLSRGQQIWLKVNPADLFGSVVWIDGEECGILFDEPLDDCDIASLHVRGKVTINLGLSPEEQLGAEDWQSGFMR